MNKSIPNPYITECSVCKKNFASNSYGICPFCCNITLPETNDDAEEIEKEDKNE